MGDGGSAGDPENRAQDLSGRLGKLLRLDVDRPGPRWEMVGYGPGIRGGSRSTARPATSGSATASRRWRRSSCPGSGSSWTYNFGWDVFEGTKVYEDKPLTRGGRLVDRPSTRTTSAAPLPEATSTAASSGRSMGRYFFGDYCSGRIWSLSATGRVGRQEPPIHRGRTHVFRRGPERRAYAPRARVRSTASSRPRSDAEPRARTVERVQVTGYWHKTTISSPERSKATPAPTAPSRRSTDARVSHRLSPDRLGGRRRGRGPGRLW